MNAATEKPWIAEKKDKRSLSELITTWFDTHGTTLDNVQNMRDAMLFASDYLKNPLL